MDGLASILGISTLAIAIIACIITISPILIMFQLASIGNILKKNEQNSEERHQELMNALYLVYKIEEKQPQENQEEPKEEISNQRKKDIMKSLFK